MTSKSTASLNENDPQTLSWASVGTSPSSGSNPENCSLSWKQFIFYFLKTILKLQNCKNNSITYVYVAIFRIVIYDHYCWVICKRYKHHDPYPQYINHHVSLGINTFCYITTGQLSHLENFTLIHNYFLTDCPYLNIASPPSASPSLHATPIRGANQGLWVACSCLVSFHDTDIFWRRRLAVWNSVDLDMSDCLFMNRRRSGFGLSDGGSDAVSWLIASRRAWLQPVLLWAMVTPITNSTARYHFAFCNTSNLWGIYFEIV